MADLSFTRSFTEQSSLPSSLSSAVSTTRSISAALWSILVDSTKQPKMVGAALCGIPLVYVGLRALRGKRSEEKEKGSLKGAQEDGHSVHSNCESLSSSVSDSSLIRKHSEIISVTTKYYTYPAVRVFYRPHPKASVLPPKLPLLVFLHGLGGQISQYQYLLEFFVHVSHTLAIDLPGCGSSEFSPKDWDAYTFDRLIEAIAEIVNQKLEDGQQVVFIAHSMGCAHAATLAAKGGLLADKCAGLVAIGPKATASEKELKMVKSMLALPEIIFDLFRVYDRWGGTVSRSVTRFLGQNAAEKIRNLQMRFNKESRTPVVRRMLRGIRLPTEEQWTSINCPIYLLAGAEDQLCTTKEVDLIHSWFDPSKRGTGSVSAASVGSTSNGTPSSSTSTSPIGIRSVVKKCIIPDAGHGVFYETPQVVSGLIGEFLSGYVTEVLSLGWQLLYLKEDKWLLKNLEKWNQTQSVSPRMGGSISLGGQQVWTPFRAMKTLRQNDPNGHNPAEFSAKWPDIRDVIDISHEQPPYDPETFGEGVKYHKFPTVSKIPPTPDEVASFIKLVDSIREQRGYDDITIACHCHYGFNRTGFFVCCYMIQRLGFSVEEAIKAFKDARPPGIRHPHFINELFERHCLGLVRAPTF